MEGRIILERCRHSKYEICGTLVCGICYEEELLNAPLVKHKQQVTLISVYDPVTHRYRTEVIPYESNI